MKNFSWEIMGIGKINVIILNGWGINSKIWLFIIQELRYYFKFHLIDLPGSGQNKNLIPIKIDKIVEILRQKMPKDAIWIGWSLGGIIVNYFGLHYPEYILAIINVASSPCFIEKKNWPGIKKKIINNFYFNLKTKYHYTIRNFLDLEKINSEENCKDIIILKNILSLQSSPNIKLLKNSLEIILLFDLRVDLTFLQTPLLRIYGELDNLVPKKIISILDKKWPKTKSIIIKKSAHAPFITKKKEFCYILSHFNHFL
ncbi:pimeloyl-[acyl-carrier protein] methyl ester esterase [Buchnera aphidicola (Macrosiphoniella sanborni)]|uniref:Pimeloyl-[acyl-carrier protein] methyl ester esterase n=1 Tax=Buchnera aphidicola (Macrosiphoniella sanborni) TaxID=1241865 RepID=A0A4D6Y407_9GAMM|nr:pimeloyl-ACP methyl ester esterase BioH [Buchnera aphidicola]QCI24047.1 pimeloyl-[acyl-carrier protein] methyl ester esterase [Buchnera aphidicola (Macrosiphoniella sanborni)]